MVKVMFNKNNPKKELLGRIFAYLAMFFSILILATYIIGSLFGFKLKFTNQQVTVERRVFLRFNSLPAGATVYIDDSPLFQKTPTKATLPLGLRQVKLKRDGYQTWSKWIDPKAGSLVWLNYALLVPKKITSEDLLEYEQLDQSLASPSGKHFLFQPLLSSPAFDLVDVNNTPLKVEKLLLTDDLYTEADNLEINHKFEAVKWDMAGRYVLLCHTFGEQKEWLVLDTQNVNLSKNITRIFNINIDQIDFFGPGGNIFFVLDKQDIRKINLSAGTISRVLVDSVESFKTYQNKEIIFQRRVAGPVTLSEIGVYRDGMDTPKIIKQVESDNIKIALTRYFNDDYIAYSDAKNVYLLNPQSQVISFEVSQPPDDLEFSATGQYLLIRTGQSFMVYDIEYENSETFSKKCQSDKFAFGWLNETHLWFNCDNKLTIQDFDGANSYSLGAIANKQDVLLSHTNKHIYTTAVVDDKFLFQRINLVAK